MATLYLNMSLLGASRLIRGYKTSSAGSSYLVLKPRKLGKHWNSETVRNNVIKKTKAISNTFAPDDQELEEFDVDDNYHQLAHLEQFYDQHMKEMENLNKMRAFKTTERKYFKKPQQVNLLTWAAKEKIRYLHHTDGESWTLERLAASFPISKEGIKKLLKSNFTPKTQRDISEHDRRVLENYKKLGIEGGPIKVNTAIVSQEEKNDFDDTESCREKIGPFVSLLMKTKKETGEKKKMKGVKSLKIEEKEITAQQFMKETGIKSLKGKRVNDFSGEPVSDSDVWPYPMKYKQVEKRSNIPQTTHEVPEKIDAKKESIDPKSGLIQIENAFYDENGHLLYIVPQ